MVIELVETIEKVATIFRSNAQFFLQGAGKKIGLNDRRAVSQQ